MVVDADGDIFEELKVPSVPNVQNDTDLLDRIGNINSWEATTTGGNIGASWLQLRRISTCCISASSLGYSLPFTPVSVGRLRFFIDGHSGTLSGIKVGFYEIPVAGTHAPSRTPTAVRRSRDPSRASAKPLESLALRLEHRVWRAAFSEFGGRTQWHLSR